MEYTGLDEHPDVIVFSMVTTNEKSHDLGLGGDLADVPGRLHHLAFWVDAVEDVLRAADILMEAGGNIEFGPGNHGMGEQTYLYFREPGGIRLEVNSGGYRNYQPDWEPVHWVPAGVEHDVPQPVNAGFDDGGVPAGRRRSGSRARAGGSVQSVGAARGGLMAAVRNVLIVGGGPSGLTAATTLRNAGIQADIVEVNDQLRPLGSG